METLANSLKCIGGILGDILGSPYEFHGTKDYNFKFRPDVENYTDDSVCTVATMDAVLNHKKFDECYRLWGNTHFNVGYGPAFRQWLVHDQVGPYNSFGNGSGMRVSPVGWFYHTLEETLEMAKRSAEVTHNHPEGIIGAQCIAGCVYLARTYQDKDKIREFCRPYYGELRKLEEFKDSYKFEVSCQRSVPEAIECFLEGENYEDVVRKAISLGGDADTQACMAGSIAEAYGYNVSDEILERLELLDGNMLKMLYDFNVALQNKGIL